MRRVDFIAWTVTVMAALTGCHTMSEDPLKLAVLADDSPQAKAALVREMDRIAPRGRVDIVGHDPTKDSVLVVQPFRPGPHEGNSPAVPVHFDLMTDGKSCFARERSSQSMHELPGVACRPK